MKNITFLYLLVIAFFNAGISAMAQQPGGVPSSNLWYKADAGITEVGGQVDAWDNQVSASNHLSNGGVGKFNYLPKGLNFNPTIDNPDGGNRRLISNTAIDLRTLLIVSIPDPSGSCNTVFAQYNSNNYKAVRLCLGPSYKNEWAIPGNVADFTASNSASTSNGAWPNGWPGGLGWFNGLNTTNPAHNNQAHVLTLQAPESLNYSTGIELGTAVYNRFWQGDIAEIIGFDKVLTTPERQKVESYLAIKYGITLDQTTTQNNYVASDGSKLWDKDIAASYKHDIFGIAKDLNSALNQQISESINSDAFFILSTDTNFKNTNGTHTDTLENLEAVMLSNNNGSLSRQTTEICQCAGHERIGREWLMQVSGTTPDVNLAFDKADLTVSENEEVYLLISTTGNFSNNLLSFHKMELNANNKYTTVLPTNTDNVYLSIGIVDKNKTRLRHGKRFIFQQLLKPVDNE